MPPYPGTEESSLLPALGCTAVSIAFVCSPLGDLALGTNFIAHVLGAMVLAFALMVMYFMIREKYVAEDLGEFATLNKKSRSRQHAAGEDKDSGILNIMRGTVKKYSEKKGWGTISVKDGDDDSDSDLETRVRFLREDKERLGLDVGDPVAFRAVKDDEMEGWLLADTIWRAPSEKPASREESLNLRPSRQRRQQASD
eukprot:TRINITY_DN29167_c0_g1_i2.p2 TRINITY_DN29167_c0_g1~~TRINITY_DN29167_c0_g1_i2.p2  ORF type:complete len:198 (+),score=30.98 TRINITY_DN29167_c0_g1_i2:87-680(+)